MIRGFSAAALGVWGPPARYTVTSERIAAYAEATNDPIDAHRCGDIASPVFAAVPTLYPVMAAGLSAVPIDIATKVLHERQEFRLYRPIVPDDELVCRARPIGYLGRPHKSMLTVHAESRTVGGELVNEQWVTLVFPGHDAKGSAGDRAPEFTFDERTRERPPLASIVAHVDKDQTFRYASASGDPVQIHLDDEVARRAGFPGIVAHGLCMMGFASWALLTEVAGSRTDRLKRLAVRFARPVLPGQDITTTMWSVGDDRYAYETTVADTAVLTDGFAHIELNG